jgi:Family of unknown function (DUF6370)
MLIHKIKIATLYILKFCVLQLVSTQCLQAQSITKKVNKVGTVITNKIVPIACGQCQFKMPGKGCTLAIKINNTAYFVSGASIDSFGDAHASNGFCNAISKAIVSGTLQDSIFKVKLIKLK